jgi:hypothetical protein
MKVFSISGWETLFAFNQRKDKAHAPYTSLAKVAVQCSEDTFMVNQTFVLRINICDENSHIH